VEIRPGVFHTVEVAPKGGPRPGAGDPSPARARRPSSAPVRGRPSGGQGASPAGLLPYQMDTVQMAPVVAKLEEQMREQLRRKAALHIKERTILLRAFAKALGKRDVELVVGDKVVPEQFAAVWSDLGVPMTKEQVFAVYNKYGHDAKGRMPVLNFVEALMYGAPRQLMLENDYVQKGAYKAGQPASHTGKIQYPQCKKGVWPPSNWTPHLAERSAQLPDLKLKLEFVYGYDGLEATAPNIFYTRTGEVAYHAAAVGIVYNRTTHAQRFFLEHDDDILCMAIHPDRSTVATGQVGKDPVVYVWDTLECRTIKKLAQGYGNRGITACCFSPDGSKLACIATDNNHTMYLWDWRRGQLLMERKTAPGTPPTTYGVIWSPFETERMVTYGQNYIKFWQLLPPGGSSSEGLNCRMESGIYNIVKTHTVLGAVFLPSGIVLTGNQMGCICSWKGNRLQRETPGHATGPLLKRPDGTKMYGGVRCLVLQSTSVLLSGGADGYVIKWDVSKGDLGPALQRLPLLRPDLMDKITPPGLRGLDCFPGSEVFIAGTSSCDIWEVDDTPQLLIFGASGDLYGLAMNPKYPHVFAAITETDTVMLLSAATRKPIRLVQLAQNGDKARSGAFSADGEHLAIGMISGGIKVMQFYPNVSQVFWGREFTESVDEMKYSPCGRYLAAGSHDQNIYIFDAHAGYKRIAKLTGHSSTITHLDWSRDSSVIQSTDQAYELLYFDPLTGRQVKENQRDTQWATWTSTLGFDVMGIWPPYSDGTDVNACDKSPDGHYLLTSDDFGKVRLFNAPVVVQHAPAHTYGGHSSHVMNVRWGLDQSFAVSVGGRDRCVFQWKVMRDVPEPPKLAYNYVQLDKNGLAWVDPNIVEQRRQQQQQQAQQQQHGVAGPAAVQVGKVTPNRPPSGREARPGGGVARAGPPGRSVSARR